MARASRGDRAVQERIDLAATANVDDPQHVVEVRFDRRGALMGAAEGDSPRAAAVRATRRPDPSLLSRRSDVSTGRRLRGAGYALRPGEPALASDHARLTIGSGRPLS